MAPPSNEIVVLSGNTHPQLADTICSTLGLKKADITIFRAANRETLITIPDSVRSRDVYIIQTATHTNVNDSIVEMLLMGYTCKTSAAKNIVGILPYLPYGKQTKQRKRGAIPSRLLAKLISEAGYTHIVTVDLHHKEVIERFCTNKSLKIFSNCRFKASLTFRWRTCAPLPSSSRTFSR